MNSVRLHQKIRQEFDRIGMAISKAQQINLALWCQGLASSDDCHLTNLALEMPISAERESLVERLHRSLKNERMGWHASYGSVVRHLFRHWQGKEVALVMDRTDLAQRWSILLLGVAYQGRVLPLAWRILPFGGTSAEVQMALLRQIRPYLPAVRIYYYGDCEFRAVALQALCHSYQWHWQVGLKGDTYIQQAADSWIQLRHLPLVKGERRYWQQVYLTQQQAFGPVNLIADWSVNQDAPRYWALDLPADPQAFRRGRKRFWIEPTFRDWKSYGFDLERSQIDDPKRLHVLVLAMALTTLWLIHVGEWVRLQGHDHWLEREHTADYSLFRLGRDYLKRSQAMNWSVPVGFTVSHP